MIRIEKGKQPKEWTEKKSTTGFAKYERINELAEALLKEQGYVCAYCTRRIPVKDEGLSETSIIEYLLSRSEYAESQLDYNNMVICCPGYLDFIEHCDRSKRGKSITFNLFSKALENSIFYKTKDGHIQSTHPNWQEEINHLLNLNHSLLKANRRSELDGFIAVVKRKSKKGGEPNFKKRYEEWSSFDASGKKKPYSGIVLWYLKKKIKQQQ